MSRLRKACSRSADAETAARVTREDLSLVPLEENTGLTCLPHVLENVNLGSLWPLLPGSNRANH